MCFGVTKFQARADRIRDCDVLSQPPTSSNYDSGRTQGKNTRLAVRQDYTLHAHHDVLLALLTLRLLCICQHFQPGLLP